MQYPLLRQAPPLLLLFLLVSCGQRAADLQQIRDRGLLRVTLDTPGACAEGQPATDNLHCELARRFAHSLGAVVQFVPDATIDEVISRLRDQRADLALAVPDLPPLRKRLRLTPPYQRIRWFLVYRQGRKRPRDLGDLAGGEIVVPRGSSQELLLESLRTNQPALSWTSQPQSDSLQLLELLQQGRIGATLVDSATFAIQRRHLPELRIAFPIGEPSGLCWGTTRGADRHLLRAAKAFLSEMRKDGTLKQLEDRYLGHVERLNYVERRTFQRHLKSRLPAFRKLFELAAVRHGLSWRLLAAIGYQESHWNPKAVSPTGVRGLMMLSRITARRVGIDDRTDPAQSIEGAARYLVELRKKIPARIPEPDHTWLALAAYNIGFTHLEDARILTQRRGGDPDRWMDVRRHLPLLEKPEIAATLKHGAARGSEAVNYVENIRNYLEMLEFMTRDDAAAHNANRPAKAPAVI